MTLKAARLRYSGLKLSDVLDNYNTPNEIEWSKAIKDVFNPSFHYSLDN